MNKEARKLVRAAEKQGWRLETSRHGHPKLVAPDGFRMPFSQNPRGRMMVTAKKMVPHGFDPDGLV